MVTVIDPYLASQEILQPVSNLLSSSSRSAIPSKERTARNHYKIRYACPGETTLLLFASHTSTHEQVAIKILKEYQDTRYHMATNRERQQCQLEAMLEEQEIVDELITAVADGIAGMHTHQQRAAICRLKEKMDDFSRLAAELARRNVDCGVEYPKESAARQKLQSSYPPAKRKLAIRLGVDLTVYK